MRAMDLTGKHVVVTGAANGIGKALAERFHRAGADVVVSDIDAVRTAEVAAALNGIRPDSAAGVPADVGSEQGNIDLIRAAEAAFGTVDLFFANAGVGVGTDLETPEDVWELAFNVNTHAHRWAAKHLLPTWLDRGEGYFCSTASAAGLLSQIGSAPYSLTKHAAVAFAEWMSLTYGSRGLRVSCLCPQGVNTNMLNSTAPEAGVSSSVVRSAGNVLEPAEVAEIALGVIEAEMFLIAPHPEVLTYWGRKVTDYDRWLAGMRKLQARISGEA
ncbi:MAG: putative oxidoreductase [Ilumatobacteraceae bacterium]|nr:putative oxidoreductase [Ilumatobacteraceae bacterium]